jgi:glycerol-1-phosphate dehydrogenase [NAD(P)+]
MMSWFEKITPALKAERLLEDPGKSPLIPAQFYCTTLQVFKSAITRLIHDRKWGKKKISVFVDGVSKISSEGSQGDLDAAFRDLLKAMDIPFDWIDLSRTLRIRPGELHASHTCLEKIRPVMKDRKDHLIITLGSGSLTDLIKHALCLEGISAPLITVPTALTVTAYTSSFAIFDFHGAKRTLMSRPVTASFWIKPFLESAPSRMSRAGYGDLLARFVATGDWFLGHRLGVMDRYDEGPYRLMEPFVSGIKANAAGFTIHPLPRETTACTAAALAMAGIAMSVAGETTPLSGYEHVISHALDFLHLLEDRELVLHGEQVALGSVISARTIDWLLGRDTPDTRTWRHDPVLHCLAQLDEALNTAPWPKSASRVLAQKIETARQEFHVEYRKKAERWLKAFDQIAFFAAGWQDIKAEMARITIRAIEMEQLAGQAGLPVHPGETSPPTSDREFRWAVRFAPFVRSRMNIADLIFWMGKDPAFILRDPFVLT